MTTVTKVAPGDLLLQRGELRRFYWLSSFLFLVHAALMLVRYGYLPIAPALGDEVIINDAAISLGTGHGFAATSYVGSGYGLDRIFAHFPPLYPLTESLAIRWFGVSVYSLRLTTTLMSIAACAVFLYLLMRLCRSGLLSWSAAGLAAAIYCTFTPLIVLERIARMETMIELIALLSFAAILQAVESDVSKRGYWLVLSGALAGLSVAVHPEAIAVMLPLAILALGMVPGERTAKIVSVVAAAVVPVAIWILTFGKRSGMALRQFREILHGATPVDPGLGGWARNALRARHISELNQNAFLLAIILLIIATPVAYFFVARKLPASKLGRRMAGCFAVAALLELAIMEWGLRTDFRRYMFLFGFLLIGFCVAGVGNRLLSRLERVLGWLLVAVQICAAGFYFYPRADRLGQMDSQRFMPIVNSIPTGDSVLTSASLWLDFRSRGIPIALLYGGKFDGIEKWMAESTDPFQQFDFIIMNESDAPWGARPPEEATRQRTKRVYVIGGDIIDVYQRDGGRSSH